MVSKLVEYLKRCDEAYYNSGTPLINDDTYDAIVESLRRIDPENPYLHKVGAPPKKGSTKVGRLDPMGTLSKYTTDERVHEWLTSESGDTILISPKYDGFAVELIYKDGYLVAATTRGDGYVGEDVLAAIMKIQSVPIKLYPPFDTLERVRGEVIIPKKNHAIMKSLGYNAMRNAVPGIVRSNRTDALIHVDFVAYEFFDDEFTRRDSQRDHYRKVFKVEDYITYHWNEFDLIKSRREELRSYPEYELDGIVLKTNIIQPDDLLHPSHMIAWKYKSNRETTTFRGIEYQLGLTGYFTPIGIFDPVEFQGATLTRASLGNMTRLANDFKGLTIESLVDVSRRGDIIPYIEELVYVEEHGEKVDALTHCPHCGSELQYDELEPRCVNTSCPEKLRLQIAQYAKSIGIKGIGDKLVRGLIDAGHIKSILDIYMLDAEVIKDLPRQGDSSVRKWKELQDKRLLPVDLLTAYPFLDLGRRVWETILSKFSYSELMDIEREMLKSANLRGIGDTKIDSIVSQVKENYNELVDLGIIHGVL